MEVLPEDILCVCISRQVKDGEILAQGLATPLVAAGYLLAWHTHAPNSFFASAIGQSICKEGAPLGLETVEALWLDKAISTFGFANAATELLPRFKPKEFFRPGQIDSKGNTNNIAFGKNYDRPRLRLPGSGGIPDVTPILDDVLLYVPRHSRVTFVKELDFVSGLGIHPQRVKGRGAKYLVSDLGQFDFMNGRMRLTHTHPGVDVARIVAKTGFELEIAENLKVTEPLNAEELRLLNQAIDPLGIRKLELLSGAKRRLALSEILEKERAQLNSSV
jgi:acyl CoA:acetate/3-ketoacid CoA transferase beta subunit